LTDLLKQEQSVARIETHSGDSTQSAVSVRGFGDNAGANSLILINGFPLTNPSLLTPNLNSILLSDIERVDIFQGSAGSLWGDQAVGGVIHIITRHPHKQAIEGKMGLGSYMTHYYSLLAATQCNHDLFFKISGFLNQTHHYRMHNQQDDVGIFPEFGINYSRGSLDVRFQYINDTIDFPGGLTENQYNDRPVQATNFLNFSRYHTQNVQLLSKHVMSAEWILETRLSHQNMMGDGVIGLPFNRHEWISILSPRLLGEINKIKITMGYDKQYQQYQFKNKSIQKKSTAQQDSLYTQIIMPFDEYVHLTLGVRSAWQSNPFQRSIEHANSTMADRVLVTEQGISIAPAIHWQFFLRRDGNFRFPKSNEALWHPESVHSLQVQKGVSYETGVSWQGNNQKIQFILYKLIINNEIAFDPRQTSTEPFGTFHNFDQTVREGASYSDTYQLNSLFNLNTQINYVHARLASSQYKDKWIPAVPAWNGNIGLHYQFTSYWQVSLTTIYTGCRFPSEDEENVGKKLPPYWLNNAAIQYMARNGRVSFEIANIGDQRYATYAVYQPVYQSITYYPGAGRSYLLTLEANIM
jgi:iron complex outermembrane receptor protein